MRSRGVYRRSPQPALTPDLCPLRIYTNTLKVPDYVGQQKKLRDPLEYIEEQRNLTCLDKGKLLIHSTTNIYMIVLLFEDWKGSYNVHYHLSIYCQYTTIKIIQQMVCLYVNTRWILIGKVYFNIYVIRITKVISYDHTLIRKKQRFPIVSKLYYTSMCTSIR